MAGRHRPFKLLASSNDASTDTSKELLPFPVLSKIAGVNWEGFCRYVSKEGVTASFQLTGGIRFDLPSTGNDDDKSDNVDEDDNDSTVEMSSFVVFPNGKSREIEMRYVINYTVQYPVVCRSQLSSTNRPKHKTKQNTTNIFN